MDQNQDSSLFGLNMDQVGSAHLGEAARWAKFLAIIGFIMCGIIVLIGLFFGSFIDMFSPYSRNNPYDDLPMRSGVSTIVAVYYVLIALLYFFPCLFLYRFAIKTKMALASNDQELLNSSFQNLKATFRYVGIITIIFLAFMILGFLFAILGAATGGRM